jgi:cytochrome P450
MPYLQACIKEGMRLHGAGALTITREAPPSGVYVKGRYSPPGSVLGVSAAVLHRDKAVWGEDAEVYRPEKWLEFAERGKMEEVEASYLVFSRGSRSCVGKHIAMIEIEKVVSELVREFDFEIPE